MVLVWIVYWRLPRFRKLLEDFGLEGSSLLGLVLNYSAWVLPFTVIVSALAFVSTRSHPLKLFLLAGLPGVLTGGLLVVIGPTWLDLLERFC